MNPRNSRRFTPTSLFMTGGLLAWMTAFLIMYVLAAVACARRFTHVELLGWPIVPLMSVLVTLSASAVTALLLRAAYRRYRQTPAEHERFIQFVTLATNALLLVTLLWIGAPPLLIQTCAPL